MPGVARLGKRDRPVPNGFHRISQHLRSQLTWPDFLFGLCAAVLISLLFVAFRYHAIPDYQSGDTATAEVRALQDTVYEDEAATAAERAAARDRTPAVYDFDGVLVARIERDISRTFSLARELLSERKVAPQGNLSAGEVSELAAALRQGLGNAIPPNVLPLLIQQRFNVTLEARVLHILDTIFRGCIVDEQSWPQFLRAQQKGITVRDNSSSTEHPLPEAYMVRNPRTAREYLRQFQQEFPELAPADRTLLLNFMDTLLVPNLLYNQAETDRRREAAGARVMPVEVSIPQGKTVVRKGEVVTPEMVTQLAALKRQQRPTLFLAQFAGYLLFVSTFLYALWRYLVLYQNRQRNIRRQALLILLVMVAVFTLMRLFTGLLDIVGPRLSADWLEGPVLLYYVIPFAFGAVLITLLVDANLGFISSMLVSTLVGLFYRDSYIAAYTFLGSLAGVYSVRRYRDRAAILKAGLTIACANMAAILGIGFLRQIPVTFPGIAVQLGFGFASGALASALASTFLPTMESLFKITTDVRLLELSNLNAPLLRRLSVEAPGTYHHSLMLATLAENAAEAIGANSLRVRVGAYYHDVGKIFKPEYYVENQSYGINKHESLSPNMSCLVIASHVKDGLELAKEARLSPDICDLIPQHHGTRIMTFFYRKALDSANGKNQEIEEQDFRYPGPKPQTKEAAILMMADSIEAASRTLSDPSPAQLQGMVDRLVDAILADNQLDECDITLREIGLVKESFLKILSGLYHRRLDYPGYDFKNAEDKSEKNSAANSNSKHAKAV